MVSGFFFPSPLFSSNRFSIFDTFVFHLLPNQIFSTFFQLFVIFDCLAKKRSFFFLIHYLRFGYVHFLLLVGCFFLLFLPANYIAFLFFASFIGGRGEN